MHVSASLPARTLLYALPLVLLTTLLAALVAAAVQQDQRQTANDPQIQLAEDTAAALAAGQPVTALVPATKVDLATSLAPYLIVYDDAGRPVAASATLNGAIPALPAGVLDAVRPGGEDRITWQPQAGVRGAAVITRVGGAAPGFVLAGRSLREVEKRIDALTGIVLLAWLGGLVVSVASGLLLAWALPRLV